jgi:hypothetical protein
VVGARVWLDTFPRVTGFAALCSSGTGTPTLGAVVGDTDVTGTKDAVAVGDSLCNGTDRAVGLKAANGEVINALGVRCAGAAGTYDATVIGNQTTIKSNADCATGTPLTGILGWYNIYGGPHTNVYGVQGVCATVTGLDPTITGRAQVGQTLTAHAGPVSPADSTLSYQWNADGTPIVGANGSTLYVDRSLAGSHLSVTITASHVDYTSETETSAATDYVREFHARRTFSVDDPTPQQGETVQILGQGLVPGNTYKVVAFAKTKVQVADEYGEIHVDITVPGNYPPGPAPVTIVGANPASVDSLLLQVRKAQVVVVD